MGGEGGSEVWHIMAAGTAGKSLSSQAFYSRFMVYEMKYN
jgi:hypothetical protein